MMNRAVIILVLLSSVGEAMAQMLPQRDGRNNTIYVSPIKGVSQSVVSLGYEHAFRISRQKWSSARLNFVVSPNILWTGYSEDASTDGTLPSSEYEKWEISLPLLLRFELSPFRTMKGSTPGKNDYNMAAFLETGLMFNYLLSAHLNEHFNYNSGSFRFTFDGPITDYAQSKISSQYLAIGLGFRINRFSMAVRGFQPISPTTYEDISGGWGLPDGVKSFFFSDGQSNPYQQQIVMLCLGYSF